MAHAQLPVLTMRRDAWWVQPTVTAIVFVAFIVYTTWAAFQNTHYRFGPYLSPLYSPELPKPGWWPGWLLFSPALLILPFPGLFRVTCYYYRGAYYKALWADPPACTVHEPRKSYLGEQTFPLILQNVHRYFMYIALVFLVVLAHDVWNALWFTDPATGQVAFGIGVGTIVLAANTTLLSCYTFGCHSLRHVIGGYRDTLATHPVQKTGYACVSCFNRWHMKWAWMSLIFVAFTDVYVRLCSMGVWHDLRIL